jgi:AraC family transcriptional activator of tynA and feaB
MAQIRVWSTEGMAPRQRVEYWNDCAVEALTVPMSVDAADPGCFWGRIEYLGLNNIHIAEVSSGAAAVRHSAKHAARTASGAFHFLVQLAGRLVYSQGGREVCLAAGDFTLVDCNRPYDLLFGESVANLVLTINHELLKTYFPCPEALAGMKLSGESGPSALASRFLRELWSKPGDLTAGSASPFLDRAVLDILALAYSSVPADCLRGSQHAVTRRMMLLKYIEQHLKDPDLGAESIAAAFNVTPRCIYRLLEGESESLAKYIRRRRIEECATALSNPMHCNRSISSIAYDHGFNSIAHFSKIFHEQLGVTPTEYRTRQASYPTASRRIRPFD